MADASRAEALSTAETLLDGLAKRQEIRLTLILSRRDGSIIRATGAATEQETQTLPGTVQDSKPTEATPQDDHHATPNETSASVEKLARGVFQFVAAAEELGSIVASTVDESSVYSRTAPAQEEKRGVNGETEADKEVQLLRLRLYKQEVIVFPNPSYLCCVVQSLDKTKQ